MIIIGDGDDVTHRPTHPWQLPLQHDRLAVADRGGLSLQPFTIHCPCLALHQMGGKPYPPARYVSRDSFRLLFRSEDEIGKPSTRYALGNGGHLRIPRLLRNQQRVAVDEPDGDGHCRPELSRNSNPSCSGSLSGDTAMPMTRNWNE
jgi:hypothetical protein